MQLIIHITITVMVIMEIQLWFIIQTIIIITIIPETVPTPLTTIRLMVITIAVITHQPVRPPGLRPVRQREHQPARLQGLQPARQREYRQGLRTVNLHPLQPASQPEHQTCLLLLHPDQIIHLHQGHHAPGVAEVMVVAEVIAVVPEIAEDTVVEAPEGAEAEAEDDKQLFMHCLNQ